MLQIQASEYTGTGKVDEAEADESDLSSFLSKTSVLMMEAITENTNLRALDGLSYIISASSSK